WPGGAGSGSGATWSGRRPRRSSPATGSDHRGGERPSGSSTRTVANATPASAVRTSSSTPPCLHETTPMRLLHLHWPHLPLALTKARASESFPTGPTILGGQPWTAGTVIDASPEARALGVRRGIPLGAAHRLAPEAVFLDPDPDADAAALEAAFERL